MLFAAFMGGIGFGKARAVNEDITKQTAYMQSLIDVAYEERDEMKAMYIEAQEQAETWRRRYENLVDDYYSLDEEEEIGS